MTKWIGPAAWSAKEARACDRLPYARLVDESTVLLRDGSVMTALADWAQRLITFRPGAAELVAPVHWVYKAHIVLGLTLFLVTPFTRLVHIWSIPLSYLWRPYQVVRRRQRSLNYGPRD